MPTAPLLFRLFSISLLDVEAQTLGVQVQLVSRASLLNDLCDLSRVLDSLQVDIRSALLNSISNKLGRSSLTLCSHNHRLLLLAGLIDHKGCALGFLLGNLLGFDCSSEFRREGKVLIYISIDA